MTARCIDCNKSHRFRNQRGAKLSERRCDCGGKLEIIGGSISLLGEHPFDEKCTYEDTWTNQGKFFYADRNRKGEYFVWHEGYWHKIENPIFKQSPASLNDT